MKSIIKNISIIIALLMFNGFSHTVLAADSTSIQRPKVQPKVDAYVLAQGKVTGTGQLEIPTTNRRCPAGTTPYLRTSLSGTYVNSTYLVKGIRNSLGLVSSNYHIVGDLHMDNAATYDNSEATANWQIWCQPA